MTIENIEGALGTLEAYFEGGDELGVVSEIEAMAAFSALRRTTDMTIGLRNNLTKVTAERDALKAERDMLRAQVDGVSALTVKLIKNPGAAFAILSSEYGHYFDAIPDVDAFVAAQRRGEDATWQPVSQALPARGTEQVLAVLKSGRTREVVRARYIYQYEVPDSWYDGDPEYCEPDGHEYTPQGWHVFNEHEGVYEGPIEFGDTVTHWMPMPALPEEVTQ